MARIRFQVCEIDQRISKVKELATSTCLEVKLTFQITAFYDQGTLRVFDNMYQIVINYIQLHNF